MALVQALLVIDEDVVQRMGTVPRHLCVGMIDEAVQMTVLSRSSASWVGQSVGVGRVVSLPEARWPWQRPSSDGVLEVIGGRKPDVVHCMSASLARWASRWTSAWDVPLIVQLTDLHDVTHFAASRVRPHVVPVVGSSRLERALLEKMPALAERVKVIPPGLPAQPEPVCFKDPEQVPAAVVTCELTRHCGLDVVLRALKLVIKAGAETQLFVLATGRAEGYFRHQVETLGLRPYVTFAGRMRDWSALAKAMLAADFYIRPHTGERYSISSLAALAGGMVILASRPAIQDYLIDGTTACLFDASKPKPLADKWLALLKDPPQARRLAQSAMDYARLHHQASRMVQQTSSLYRELAESPAAETVEADQA